MYDAPEAARNRHARELIKPGDVVIFYVAKKNSERLGGMFVGAYRVAFPR